MNDSRIWTAVYVLLATAALLLFFLGQWGAATTVLALTALINRANFIGSLLQDVTVQQRNITEELIILRRAATDQDVSDTSR